MTFFSHLHVRLYCYLSIQTFTQLCRFLQSHYIGKSSRVIFEHRRLCHLIPTHSTFFYKFREKYPLTNDIRAWGCKEVRSHRTATWRGGTLATWNISSARYGRLQLTFFRIPGSVHKVRHAQGEGGVREGVTFRDRERVSRACDVTLLNFLTWYLTFCCNRCILTSGVARGVRGDKRPRAPRLEAPKWVRHF